MLTIRSFLSGCSFGFMVVGASMACGQSYPNKPIHVVTADAGAGDDFAARIMAQGLTVRLGQPVIVDNRPALVPAQIVSNAAPDGYTLLLGGVIYTFSHLMQETSYDPVSDFESISTVGISPLILVVHPLLPVTSVRELIAYAKA